MDIILDFDGTITTQDTIAYLGRVALDFQSSKGNDLSSEWAHILQAYEEDYRTYVSKYEPQAKARLSVEDETRFLRGLQQVDSDSVRRVVQSGLFNGLGPSLMKEAGVRAHEQGHVELRPGFRELIRQAARTGHRVSVISVNWSTSFIRGVISDPTVRLFANEITDDGRITSPDDIVMSGEAGRPITTCRDKLEVLQLILSDGRDTDADADCVYIGDSPTDLECLLHSIGVVLCPDEDSDMVGMLRRLSVQVPHVTQAGSGGRMFWAQDFSDILDSGVVKTNAESDQ